MQIKLKTKLIHFISTLIHNYQSGNLHELQYKFKFYIRFIHAGKNTAFQHYYVKYNL